MTQRVADKSPVETADLRYLEAHSVRCQAGSLSDFRVCTADSEPLGSVDGVLISPSSRRLEFFVIESPGMFVHRRFLLPVDAGAVVQDDPKTLRLTAKKDELELQAFRPKSVPEFSDDDLIRTMFAQDAA
jgi:hypothetical protein